VISYLVTQRTREIGVRMALGATGNEVRGMVLRQGVGLAIVGAAIGLLGTVLTGRVLRSLMVGVDPGDPVVYAVVAALLVFVAAAATYLPARRATRIDPSEALRPE
jgi:ABC-type antimicrobial peptide transport system permease subunit